VPGTDHGPCRAPGNSESARSKARWSKGTASRLPALSHFRRGGSPATPPNSSAGEAPPAKLQGPSCTGGPGEGFAFAFDHTPASRERDIAELACGRSEAEGKSQEREKRKGQRTAQAVCMGAANSLRMTRTTIFWVFIYVHSTRAPMDGPSPT
jgi:hypothetical protein